MIAQAFIAGAAAFALATGAGPDAVKTPPTGTEAKATGTTARQVTDHEGNELTLELDDSGKVVKAHAKDSKGRPLKVVRIRMQDMKVCIPRTARPRCQPLAFVSDGAFFKMGTASCTCYVIGGIPYCYGDTCH